MVDSRDISELQHVSKLAQMKCHGSLSEEDLRDLAELLESSQTARDEYREIVALHAQLEWELGGRTTVDEAFAQQMRQGAQSVETARVGSFPPQKRHRSSWGWLALAACLVIAVLNWNFAWRAGVPPQANDTRAHVAANDTRASAVLSPLVADSAWSFGRPGGDNATEFRQGDTILLSRGAVQLKFSSHTVAMLESPALMQLVAPDRIRMIQGGVKVDVAEGAEGFTVETATAEVVDLGTSFSVSVADGNTDLVVFDGEVDLKLSEEGSTTLSSSEERVTRLRAGEAVQVGSDSTVSRIATVRQSDLVNQRKWPLETPIITEVRDNIVREGFYSFYEIVPGGMQEDATAFVDRSHEWNGRDKAGMPAYLVGGDYVKTFNDDKVVEGLHVEVTIDRPATLYVLLDQRVDPPDWLSSSFENIGDEIGVDEVRYDPNDPSHVANNDLQVGPGRSINRTHSIWKKVVKRPGIVTLGANGWGGKEESKGVFAKANMYGLVAIPLVETD